MAQAAAPRLRASRGAIVNVVDIHAERPLKDFAVYSVAKSGLAGLTRSLACELGSRGVTVNCICPGPINTGMTAPISDAAKEKFAKRRVPLRRYGDPEEVAHMVLSLALPASSFVNGEACAFWEFSSRRVPWLWPEMPSARNLREKSALRFAFTRVWPPSRM